MIFLNFRHLLLLCCILYASPYFLLDFFCSRVCFVFLPYLCFYKISHVVLGPTVMRALCNLLLISFTIWLFDELFSLYFLYCYETFCFILHGSNILVSKLFLVFVSLSNVARICSFNVRWPNRFVISVSRSFCLKKNNKKNSPLTIFEHT